MKTVEFLFNFIPPGSLVREDAPDERLRPKMNRIFLDVGNRLDQGVIDHHQGNCGIEVSGKVYMSTTGLVMHCRHLILRNIAGDAKQVEIVVHEDPDFDCFAAAYLVQKLVLDGELPEQCRCLADYAEDVDSGRLIITAGTIRSPLPVVYTLPYPVWASWKNYTSGDSVELRSLIEDAGGAGTVDREIRKNLELCRNVMKRGIELIEYCLSQFAGIDESSRGFYGFDFFPSGNPFEIELGLLADDYQRYIDDLRGEYEKDGRQQKNCEKITIRLPAEPSSAASTPIATSSGRSLSKVDGLIWNRPPACFLHKHWARQDIESPNARGYVFTFIPVDLEHTALPNGHTIKPSRVIISVLPGCGVNLRGLARALERAELLKEEQYIQSPEHKQLWRDRSVKRFEDSWITNNDPWYDGRGSDYTIVDAPRCGSLLTVKEIKDIALHFTRPLITDSFLRYIFTFSYDRKKYKEIHQSLMYAGDSATLDTTCSFHPSLAGTEPGIIKGYFLPYIQDYFFQSGSNNDASSRIGHFTIHCPGEMFFDPESRRFLIRERARTGNRQDGACGYCGIESSSWDKKIIAGFEQIHITVFHYGVGYLTVDVNLVSTAELLFDDILSFNKAVLSSRNGIAVGDKVLDHLVTRIPFISRMDMNKHQSLVYAAVKVAPETFFESEKKEMLYKLCSAVDRDGPFSTSTFTDTVMEKMYMDVAENAIYGFSKGGGCLIYFPREGVRDGESKIASLLDSFLSRDYILFLLSLHQRSTLMEFLHQLEIFDNFNERKKIARLRSTFLDFTTQGWFSQVTADELGMEKYRRWQNIFESNNLYCEIFQRLEAVDDYNRMNTANNIESFSVLVLPLLVFGSIFGMNFTEIGDLPFISVWGAVLSLITIGWWGFFVYSRRK